MRALTICTAAGVLALAVSACGGGASAPQKAVNDTTAAIYNDDLSAMQSNFDPALQQQVTLNGVSTLSQKLHAFGAYGGLTPTAADTAGGRYDYTANFGSVTMAVHVRVDQNGQIAAYRIDVPQSVAARD